ncbi:unnamed protein product, partial [marine sediment metagenome]
MKERRKEKFSRVSESLKKEFKEIQHSRMLNVDKDKQRPIS